MIALPDVWPAQRPEAPEDWRGWLCEDTSRALADRLTAATRLVVECGTWTGCSARWILAHASSARLVCVDTWRGSPEHRANPDWASRLPTLYETCQRNLWPWRERITLLRQDSLVGLGQVYAAGITPDLVYLDTKHTVGRVAAELALRTELFPSAAIVGDDFNNFAVAKAAIQHAELLGRPLVECGMAFAFEGKAQGTTS